MSKWYILSFYCQIFLIFQFVNFELDHVCVVCRQKWLNDSVVSHLLIASQCTRRTAVFWPTLYEVVLTLPGCQWRALDCRWELSWPMARLKNMITTLSMWVTSKFSTSTPWRKMICLPIRQHGKGRGNATKYFSF